VRPKCKFFPGSARDPLEELTALLRPPSWWGGDSEPPGPLPKNLFPLSAFGLGVPLKKNSWLYGW